MKTKTKESLALLAFCASILTIPLSLGLLMPTAERWKHDWYRTHRGAKGWEALCGPRPVPRPAGFPEGAVYYGWSEVAQDDCIQICDGEKWLLRDGRVELERLTPTETVKGEEDHEGCVAGQKSTNPNELIVCGDDRHWTLFLGHTETGMSRMQMIRPPSKDTLSLLRFCCEPPYPKDWLYCPYCGTSMKANRRERELQRLEKDPK